MRHPSAVDSMPLDNALSASLQSWLDHELEARGIDAVVYTRYILSILQTDSFEAELGEAEFFPPSKKGTVSSSSCVPGITATRACYQKSKSAEKKLASASHHMDSEQRKKSAAVECLLSVSDEDCGIEGLVEELYLKIKAQINKVECPIAEAPADTESSDSVISTSPEDPAERYYAAFPALSDGANVAKPAAASEDVTCVWPNVSQLSPSASTEQKTEAKNKDVNRSVHTTSPSKKERPKHVAGQHQEHALTGSGTKRLGAGKHTRPATSWEDVSHQRHARSGSQYFRCGSQERVIRKSPKMSRKKSWPDFERHSHPPFVVPKMPMQSRPPAVVPQGAVDGGVKTTHSRISLQEIFGTDQVREIVPCKTLVVDGQLVRLCATSVNSNNLEKTANVKLQEAPMEELVALRLQQEFQMMNEEVRRPQAVAKNEEVTWYTEPIGDLMLRSPQLKPPLFQRSSDLDVAETSTSHTASLSVTPSSLAIWEDVLDDNGVYVGARQAEQGPEPETLQSSKVDESADGNSTEDSDYVDMTVAANLLHDLFDDSPEDDGKSSCSDDKEASTDRQEVSLDYGADDAGLGEVCLEEQSLSTAGVELPANEGDIFKVMSHDAKDFLSCIDCQQSNDPIRLRVSSPVVGSRTNYVSQYKGCLMPEITQNKVPDDRPMFFVGEHELNNNHSEHTKVSTGEQWPRVDSCNNDVLCNLFPPIRTSLLSTSSVLVPGYSSIWSICDNRSALCIKNACGSRGFELASQDKPNMQVSHCIFSIACQNSWCSIDCTIPASTVSMFRHSAAWQNDVWGDTLIVNPHKLWDVNNMKAVDASEASDDGYLFSMSLEQEVKSKSEVEFIEGGLYGGTLNSDDAWSTTRSDCSDDEGICDADLTWNELLSHRENTFQSNSAVELGTWTWNGGGSGKLSGSMDLLPSETSAFSTEALPPRLPHVQSEPSISKRQLVCKSGVKKHRLVQVKHLYKPDTSILKTLGLDSDSEEDYKSDGLKYSPNCHFRPIKTPLNQAASGQHAVSIDDVYVYNDFVAVGVAKKEEDDDAATLTGSVVDECGLMSSSSDSESYQLYRGDETLAVAFVPRFKVFKQHKLIQTGEHEEDDAAKLEQGLSERLLVDMKRVLMIEEEEEETGDGQRGSLTMRDLDRSLELATRVDEAPTADERPDESVAGKPALSTPTPQMIARLWSDGDAQVDGGEKAEPQDLQSTVLPSVNSIWSYDPNEQQSQGNLFDHSSGVGGGAANLKNLSGNDWFLNKSIECEHDARLEAKELAKDDLYATNPATSDQYIPDVLIEVCTSVSSGGMTPGSLPDILLHDSILSGKNPPSVGNAEKLRLRNGLATDGTVQHDRLTDVGGDRSCDSSCRFDMEHGGKARDGVVLPNYAMTNSCQFGYPEWNMADIHCVHDSADEQEPEWFQYDDNVFSDSAEMIFPMDPDFVVDRSGVGSSSGSPVAGSDQTRAAKPPELPMSHARYSTDLERSWLQDNDREGGSLGLTEDVKRLNGSKGKPCTFFLEGNCRRADCRFVHDTSQITCRFWKEGQCFKGQSCPFLHGHLNGKSLDPVSDKFLGERGLKYRCLDLSKNSGGEASDMKQSPSVTIRALQCQSEVPAPASQPTLELTSLKCFSQPAMVKQGTGGSHTNNLTYKTNY